VPRQRRRLHAAREAVVAPGSLRRQVLNGKRAFKQLQSICYVAHACTT
jgi:hypothetical protein